MKNPARRKNPKDENVQKSDRVPDNTVRAP